MPRSILHRAFRFLFPRRAFSSRSAEYATPIDLYAAMLEKLIREGRWDYVSFDVAGAEGWIQVALEEEEFAVNFAHSSDEDPVETLSACGVKIPGDWRLAYFKPRKAATLMVPAAELRSVALLLHEMFQRLFECSPDYQVRAYLE